MNGSCVSTARSGRLGAGLGRWGVRLRHHGVMTLRGWRDPGTQRAGGKVEPTAPEDLHGLTTTRRGEGKLPGRPGHAGPEAPLLPGRANLPELAYELVVLDLPKPRLEDRLGPTHRRIAAKGALKPHQATKLAREAPRAEPRARSVPAREPLRDPGERPLQLSELPLL